MPRRAKTGTPFNVKGNVVIAVMDSVPWINFKKAKAPFIRKNAKELRWGYCTATWTRPSMLSIVQCGMMPCQNDKIQSQKYVQRCMIPVMPVRANRAGYYTAAVVTIPLILPSTGFVKFVELPAYRLMSKKLIETVKGFGLQQHQPFFLLVHFDETHMAYNCKGKKQTKYKKGGDVYNTGKVKWTEEYFEYLRGEQIKCIDFLDRKLKQIYNILPPTHMIVTADHGELFGENERFGHGYWFHENLFKVPFAYIPPKG